MKVFILGSGLFGTAIGNQLACNNSNEVILLSRDKNRAKEINEFGTNESYYPNKKLDRRLRATSKEEDLLDADVIFVAIPSSKVFEYIGSISGFIKADTLIINLSKGIFENGETIVDYIRKLLKTNEVVTMKGPTFSSELIDGAHSIFTLGFNSKKQYSTVEKLVSNTNIHIDCTTDILGVEFLSVLKNVYAILIGIIDAKYNSANTRFMILTKVFSEIEILLKEFGGRKETLFLSCGYGDVGLTSLNDLSRNRTLGLLIGKGFYNSKFESNSVVLEGLKMVTFIKNNIPENLMEKLPLFDRIQDFFENDKEKFDIHFDQLVDKKMQTVLTYGTFDLLHYGHVEILRRARDLGDKLIVGISSDEFNRIKGKKSRLNYEKRKELLEVIDYVDLVIPESNWDQKIEDVINNEVDIFVMGDDWKGKFDFLEKYCKVVYLSRTPGISTTKLKSII